jgi:hypothetical protein
MLSRYDVDLSFYQRTCQPRAAWETAKRSSSTKADNFGIGDGECDRKVRLDDLAGSLDLGLERTKYHGAIIAS